MNKFIVNQLSLARAPTLAQRRQSIADWWTALELGGDTGETTWEVLDPLRDTVTECLGLDPPDIVSAESNTAKALGLISGQLRN